MKLTRKMDDNYGLLYSSMRYEKGIGEWYKKLIFSSQDRYKWLESKTGLPYYVIACIHASECAFSWNKHLHNGDPLTDRTKNVPGGRPAEGNPLFTWKESYLDAIFHEENKLQRSFQEMKWTIPQCLWFLENYNGWGYRNKNVNTPYLWGLTNHHFSGKYIKDGVFDPDAKTKQLGCAPIIHILIGDNNNAKSHRSREEKTSSGSQKEKNGNAEEKKQEKEQKINLFKRLWWWIFG